MTVASLGVIAGALVLWLGTGETLTLILPLFLSLIGLPGSFGFVAEELLVQGSAEPFPALALSLVVATAINGVSVMRCFFYLFTGRSVSQGERDLTLREWATLSLLMSILLGAGLAPGGPVAYLGQVVGGGLSTKDLALGMGN